MARKRPLKSTSCKKVFQRFRKKRLVSIYIGIARLVVAAHDLTERRVRMKQFNIKFPDELADYLAHKRDDQDVNVSGMIRRMVAEARDREIKGGTYSTAMFEVTSPDAKD